MPLPPPAPDDFALLHAGARPPSERGRPTLLWMMGLAVLVVAAVVALVWYLNSFETEEEERRRGADAQWLDQSVQFHFRRLEDDLAQKEREFAGSRAEEIEETIMLVSVGAGSFDIRVTEQKLRNGRVIRKP